MVAADERINRALADAVDRHATRDRGMRGMLKRASVVCHPESDPQKKIALDTEQDATPHPSVSYGGSSASGVQLSITTSTDQNTGISDVMGEVRAGPAQDATRTSNEDHTGCDVAMRGDGADESSGRHPSSAETTKRDPREVLNSTFRERSPGKRRHKSALLLSPRKWHWTGSVRKR